MLQEKSNKFPFYLVYGFEKFILFAQRRWWRGEFSTRPLICSLFCGESLDAELSRFICCADETGANRGAQ